MLHFIITQNYLVLKYRALKIVSTTLWYKLKLFLFLKLFYLKVRDSWASRQGGMLEGNVRWTGHYYECINSISANFSGKYCTNYYGFKYVVSFCYFTCYTFICLISSLLALKNFNFCILFSFEIIKPKKKIFVTYYMYYRRKNERKHLLWLKVSYVTMWLFIARTQI